MTVTTTSTTAPLSDEYLGTTFEQWVEQNAERIWDLLRAGDRRDTTFNALAEDLWSQL